MLTPDIKNPAKRVSFLKRLMSYLFKIRIWCTQPRCIVLTSLISVSKGAQSTKFLIYEQDSYFFQSILRKGDWDAQMLLGLASMTDVRTNLNHSQNHQYGLPNPLFNLKSCKTADAKCNDITSKNTEECGNRKCRTWVGYLTVYNYCHRVSTVQPNWVCSVWSCLLFAPVFLSSKILYSIAHQVCDLMRYVSPYVLIVGKMLEWFNLRLTRPPWMLNHCSKK